MLTTSPTHITERLVEAPMKRLARIWLTLFITAAGLPVCLGAASAQSSESNEGFFSRLFKSGSSETGPSDKNEATIDCPQIQVPSGESALRIGGGVDSIVSVELIRRREEVRRDYFATLQFEPDVLVPQASARREQLAAQVS